MTIASTLNRITYTANGVLTSFAYTFKVFFNTDLQVYLDGVLKTLTTHYTVSGVGADGGGNVTFVSPPANLVTVLIIRVEPFTQASDLPGNDKFPTVTVEDALDKLTMLAQQLNEVDGRTLKLAVTSLFANMIVPDPTAAKFLRWRTDLLGLENADIATSGALGIPVALSDGGTGATTALVARQNLGLDGQVPKNFTNRTGVSVAANDVVALDTANDSSVALSDVTGSLFKFVVAQETILNTAAGRFVTSGVVVVKSTGAIARGQYVKKSATTLAVDDAGITVGAAVSPPSGAIGIALNAAAGNVVTIFLFDKTSASSGGSGVNPIANQVYGG